MAEVRFIVNQKGADMPVFENYLFTKHSESGQKTIYRCRDRLCKARLHMENAEVWRTTEHNHAADVREIVALETQANLRKRALDTMEQPRQIFQAVVRDMPIQVASKLPSYRAIQRKIERVRKAGGVQLPDPTTLAEIETNTYQRLTHDGSQFLLWDSGENDVERIVMFATQENLQRLHASQTWLGDGTFKVAPRVFFQLYTVHAVVNSKVTPLVYALLPNKTTPNYIRIFAKLHEKISELEGMTDDFGGPTLMLLDFEQGAISGIQDVFPDTTVKGQCCTKRFTFKKFTQL